MFFGGIWRQEIKNNVKTNVVCIITKDANEDLSKIHSRMPLIMSYNEGLEFLNDTDNKFLENNDFIKEEFYNKNRKNIFNSIWRTFFK